MKKLPERSNSKRTQLRRIKNVAKYILSELHKSYVDDE